MDRIEVIDKMSSELERKFRLNEVITTIKNRIQWEQSEQCRQHYPPSTLEERMERKGRTEAYCDILSIIAKEMTMELPYSESMLVEREIKGARDYVMDELIDLNQYRGSREYDKMFTLKRKLASALETAVFNMFELGYKYGKGEDTNIR